VETFGLLLLAVITSQSFAKNGFVLHTSCNSLHRKDEARQPIAHWRVDVLARSARLE